MAVVIAKNEGDLYQTTVLRDGADPFALKPYGEPDPDVIHDYGWQPRSMVERIAKEHGAPIEWC